MRHQVHVSMRVQRRHGKRDESRRCCRKKRRGNGKARKPVNGIGLRYFIVTIDRDRDCTEDEFKNVYRKTTIEL